MIKLPKNFFTNISPLQYREYLKLLPKFRDEKVRSYVMLGFTLAALSFFGIFAINPTLSTIAELKRKLADMEFVHQKLLTKAHSLSALQELYESLSGDLPIIMEAMPQSPQVPKSVAQVNALLSNSNLTIISYKTMGLEITPEKQSLNKNSSSFTFALQAKGKYGDIVSFIQKLTHINRLITIESISLVKEVNNDELLLNLRGRQYFKS